MLKRLLLIAIVVLAGCEEVETFDSRLEAARAHVSTELAFILALGVDDPSPVVPDVPDGPVTPENCDNCKSSDWPGWLGDGRPRTPCPVCNADGKIPAKPRGSAGQSAWPKIDEQAIATIAFAVGEKVVEHLKAALEHASEHDHHHAVELPRPPKAVSEKPGVSKLQSTPHAKVGVPENYQRRWFNHDGLSLRKHAEVYHRRSTEGLTDAEVAYWNDVDHDSWQSGNHYPCRAAVAKAATASRSTCPPGGCPPQSSGRQQAASGWYLGKNLGRPRPRRAR